MSSADKIVTDSVIDKLNGKTYGINDIMTKELSIIIRRPRAIAQQI